MKFERDWECSFEAETPGVIGPSPIQSRVSVDASFDDAIHVAQVCCWLTEILRAGMVVVGFVDLDVAFEDTRGKPAEHGVRTDIGGVYRRVQAPAQNMTTYLANTRLAAGLTQYRHVFRERLQMLLPQLLERRCRLSVHTVRPSEQMVTGLRARLEYETPSQM